MKKQRAFFTVGWVLLMVMLAVPAAAQEQITLVWMNSGDEDEAWNRHMIETFEAEYPHIKVRFEPQVGDWRDGGVTTRMIAGLAPDVIHGWGGFFREWVEGGFFLDLRPYIDRDRHLLAYDDFPPMFWKVFEVMYGDYLGIQGAMPLYVNQTLFQINIDHFEQVGLDVPEDWTWDEFLDYGRKLTLRHDDQTTRYGVDFVGLTSGWAPMWVWANGGVMFDWPDDPLRFRMDEPVAIEALQWLQDAVHVAQIAHPEGSGSRSGFIQGEVPILNHGTAGFQAIDAAVGVTIDQWDVMPRPMGAAGRGNRIALDGMGIYAGTQHPEEAWLFLRHVTSPEANRAMAELRGRQPARISAMPVYAEQFPYLSMHHVYNAMMEDPRIQPSETVVNATQVLPIIDQALTRSIVRNEVPASVAMQGIGDAVRAMYEQMMNR